MKDHSVSLYLLLLIYGILVGCGNKPSTVVLNESSPPCWYAICPGSSTKEDAWQVLVQLRLVDHDSLIDRQADGVHNFINWRFTSETGDGSGRIYFMEDEVAYIHIIPGNSLLLEDVDRKLGGPDQVLAVSGCAESRWLYTALVYLDAGVYVVRTLDSQWRWNEHTTLAPGQTVREVVFFEPGSLRELLMNHVRGAWPQFTYAEISRAFVPWPGFDGAVAVLDACN